MLHVDFETAVDQFRELFERSLCFFAFGGNRDDATFGCGEHHQSHDTFAIDLLIILFDPDFAGKQIGKLHKLRSGTGVKPLLVGNGELTSRHGKQSSVRGFKTAIRRNAPSRALNHRLTLVPHFFQQLLVKFHG